MLILGFLLLAWVLIAPLLAKFLVVEEPLQKADAIYVLAGSSTYEERSHAAVEEYRKGIAPNIYIVDDGDYGGWSHKLNKNPSFAELTAALLESQGVPREAIFVVKPLGSGTIYEARLFKEIATEKKIKRILLVTSSYHSRRALWTFRTEMPEIDFGMVYAREGSKMTDRNSWWLTEAGWNDIGLEYLKFFAYSLFY